MIRLYEIKLKIGENEDRLKSAVRSKLGRDFKTLDFRLFEISSKSIDARDKKEIRFIYNVDFVPKLKNSFTEEKFVSQITKKNKKIKIKILSDKKYSPLITENNSRSPMVSDEPVIAVESKRPVIAGFGPAGMFAGLCLAYNGRSPIIIERGKPVEERVEDVKMFWQQGVFNPDSNPLFGEGGAGTFSDGKLTTGKNDKRIEYILEEFVEAGASDEILYIKNPHIGTDILRKAVKNIRKKIISLGGEIRFENTLIAVKTEAGSLKSLTVRNPGSTDIIETDQLILALGHSARDTCEILYGQGLRMEQKPFSIGLRIEHDQAVINRNQYGYDFEDIYKMSMTEAGMPPAEYKLSHRLDDGRGVYTFCMCPGGEIILTSAEEGTICVNGMSRHARDGQKANSALLVDVRTSDYGSDSPLAGIEFQRKYESLAFVSGGSNYRAPTETADEFMSSESIIAPCLPEFAAEGIRRALSVFGKKIRGFDDGKAVLKGIESGSSSPVRILRDDRLQSNINGIYPCGEGAGYAGGITSAAIDGLRCAEELIRASEPNL